MFLDGVNAIILEKLQKLPLLIVCPALITMSLLSLCLYWRLEYRVEDKDNFYKAGVTGTVKVKDASSQPLKAEVLLKKFTPSDSGELGTEVSNLVFNTN